MALPTLHRDTVLECGRPVGPGIPIPYECFGLSTPSRNLWRELNPQAGFEPNPEEDKAAAGSG
ncbi:Hypothetical protein (plasmid) [Pseudomonas putida]|nr:Hypothetical protein [Pseudomonas putida]